jgi:hypothetical protein
MTLLHFTFQNQKLWIPRDDEVREKISRPLPWLCPKGTDYMLCPDFFSPARRVPDKQRYTLEWVNGRWEMRLMNKVLATPERFTPHHDEDAVPGQAHIVLLLESPHIDEYTSEFTPLGPARDTTGLGIHQYLSSHVLPMLIHAGLQLQPEKRYNLCLVNPIPYQTSLGHVLGKLYDRLRNDIWCKLWPACRANFEDRLCEYRPEIVMNGCTSEIKPKETESVRAYQPEQHFNLSHPSSWQRSLGVFHKV